MGKDIENRSWCAPLRGLLLIQAGVTFATRDLDELRIIANKLGKPMPKREQIQAGGIVGVADVIDLVTESKSPWFEGQGNSILDCHPGACPRDPSCNSRNVRDFGTMNPGDEHRDDSRSD